MSKPNLRAAFALGIDSPVSAQQTFTDRMSEVAAFDAAVETLRTTLATAEVSPVIDRRAPRKNVLVYYGVGGIGKSALSQELERRYLEAAANGSEGSRAAIRIDFAEPTQTDPESYVLRIRAGLAHLARSWPAFDLALSLYWARAHPGEPLEEFINRNSVLCRAAQAIGLSEQIYSTAADVISALPGAGEVTHKVVGLVYGRIRQAIVTHRTLKTCELLPELLEADADIETLSYFPYLLAWDLDRLLPSGQRVAIFIDTYEAVTNQPTREVERRLQRSTFLMPNVLFVVTGRDRLDWADLTHAGELDFVGPERWPYLISGQGPDPRQHLVGYLSESDANSYLKTAVTEEGQPAISRGIRERIVSASRGLPLYLDLAVAVYLDILARGRTPVVSDFGEPLPAVAAQMLRDLGPDERQLLRAAALLESFDLDIIKVGCPYVPDAALRRFKSRPFLEVDAERVWPYSLHTVLRDVIREADTGLHDSWSPRERTEVAARIGKYLGQIARTAGTSGDWGREVAAFQQAIDLCARTDQFFDWLVDAAELLLTSGHWGLLSGQRHSGNDTVSALLLAIHGARERRSGRLDAAIAAANAAAAHSYLPARLRHFIILHRAHALRVAGHYSEAAGDYRHLWQNASFSSEAGYWLADHRYLEGRFDQALPALDQLPHPSAQLRGEILRLGGHIFRVNALFSHAEASYREALELARETDNMAAEGKALTDIVQTLAWLRPSDARRLRPLAVAANESVLNKIELVKLHAATAVILTKHDDPDGAEAEIERGLALTDQCGYPGGMVWCWVARALNKARRGDHDGYHEATARIAAIVESLGGNKFWWEIARWWMDAGDDFPSTTRWIDGEGPTKDRWKAVGAGVWRQQGHRAT